MKEICDRHGLWLVEDSCDALGAKYDGKMIGTWGDRELERYHLPSFCFPTTPLPSALEGRTLGGSADRRFSLLNVHTVTESTREGLQASTNASRPIRFQQSSQQPNLIGLEAYHGVLTFRTEVMSPPNEKINCFFIWRHHRARIRWNLKDSSGEGFPL